MKRFLSVFLLLLLLCTLIPSVVFASPVTFTTRVSSATDNIVVWAGTAPQYSTSSVVAVGNYSSSYYGMSSGFRFNNIAIPVGATITQAYLTFTAYTDTNSGIVVNSVIQGEASIAPQAFSTYTNFIGRVKLPYTVTWVGIAAWTANSVYNSPDISPIVQAAINQSGWTYGGSLALFWSDLANQSSSGATRRAYSYAHSPTQAVSLTIVYENVYIPPTSLTDITDLQTDVKALTTAVGKISDQNIVLTSQVNKMSTTIQTSVQSAIQPLQTTMSNIESNVNKVVQPLTVQVTALNTKMTSIEAQQQALKVVLDGIVAKEAEANTKLQSRVNGLQLWLFVLLVVNGFVVYLLIKGKSGSTLKVNAPKINTKL